MTIKNSYSTYIDSQQHSAFSKFSAAFEQIFDEIAPYHDHIHIVCIGTDRSTGDSLGPLTGHKLGLLKNACIDIHGTLDQPVHAKNLAETLEMIKEKSFNPLVIAIDACLGSMDHVGYITVSNEPMRPGAGVNKKLPEVGHISIAGIVNCGGFMDFLVLQNTRLSLVMKMADIISLGLKYVLWKKSNGNKHPIAPQAPYQPLQGPRPLSATGINHNTSPFFEAVPDDSPIL